MLRKILSFVRHRTRVAGRVASRTTRTIRYAFDLVLWTRFLGRRGPVQVSFPAALLRGKQIHHQPPVLHLSGPPNDVGHWDEGFAAVNANLFLNLQCPDILSSIRYAHPAPAFRGIYLWDSAFIAQVWKGWDLEVAEDICAAVLSQRDGDRLPHVVSDFLQSEFTQPPVMAWSMARLANGRSPAELIEGLDETYAVLARYNAWLHEHRKGAGGLFFWAHPYESGIDNSPRFSSTDESEFADTRQLASPDFSAYVVLQHESLAEIAELLGDISATAFHREQARQIAQAMNDRLWDERDGLYYDRHIGTGDFVRSKTVASLLPLWAGVPTPAMAARLRDHATNPHEFGSRIPIPSVALDDPDFVKDMWRGPVWVNTAYAVIQGLARYGFREEAADLAFRVCDGVYRTYSKTRRLYEFYDPERCDIEELYRKRGNRFKFLTLGSKPVSEFVGWTGLVNTLVIEHLVGFDRHRGRRRLCPSLPQQARNLGFSLRLPAEDLAIQLEWSGDDTLRTVLRTSNGMRVAEFAAGDAIDIDDVLSAAPEAECPV